MVKHRVTNRVDLQGFFLAHQQRMSDALAAGLKYLTHPTAKGDASESAWLKLLEDYLPERYRARKAYVLDSRGSVSEQLDVVIFDRQYSPLMLVHEGACYVPAESVYAVFEVKPTLDSKTVRYAGQKVASVRCLKRTSAPVPYVGGVYRPKKLQPILGGVLALDDGLRGEQALRHVLFGLRGAEALDLGCILKGRSFSIKASGARGPKHRLEMSGQQNSLIFFYLKLLERLQGLGTVPAIDFSVYTARLGLPQLPEPTNSMRHMQATAHRHVLKRLRKQRDFRRGYQKEMSKLRQSKKSRAIPAHA